MIDVRNLKERVSLLDLVSADTSVRKVASTRGGEYAGPCPFCGGTDRFRVQPKQGLWWCRGCSDDRWQDVIAYVIRRDGVSFMEAVRVLNGGDIRSGLSPRVQARRTPEAPRVPPEAWRARAAEQTHAAVETLWSDEGARARRFLNERGLSDDTLRCWTIGFIPHDGYDDPSVWGLTWDQTDDEPIWVPRGIVIPWVFRGEVWCLKVRRSRGKPKYAAVRGSVPVLYGADYLHGRRTLALTEGEFDAMLAWQDTGDAVDVASLGSAKKGLDPRAVRHLLSAQTIVAPYDGDVDGRAGADKLGAVSARVRRIDLPDGQDLTDYRRGGGSLRQLLGLSEPRPVGGCDRLGRQVYEPVPGRPGAWQETPGSRSLCIWCSTPLAEGDLICCPAHRVDLEAERDPEGMAIHAVPILEGT